MHFRWREVGDLCQDFLAISVDGGDGTSNHKENMFTVAGGKNMVGYAVDTAQVTIDTVCLERYQLHCFEAPNANPAVPSLRRSNGSQHPSNTSFTLIHQTPSTRMNMAQVLLGLLLGRRRGFLCSRGSRPRRLGTARVAPPLFTRRRARDALLGWRGFSRWRSGARARRVAAIASASCALRRYWGFTSGRLAIPARR